VNINQFRDGQRHDMWLQLENMKMGRLRLAITILEANGKVISLSKYICTYQYLIMQNILIRTEYKRK